MNTTVAETFTPHSLTGLDYACLSLYFAVNLAIAASHGTASAPILVDADLPFGDVAITLGLDVRF